MTSLRSYIGIEGVNSLLASISPVCEREDETEKVLNSLIAGQLLGGALFLIGVVLTGWSYANSQPLGQLFGGALILIGIVVAALAYNRRRRFVGTHEMPRTVKPL